MTLSLIKRSSQSTALSSAQNDANMAAIEQEVNGLVVGATTWGEVVGTLSSQADLQAALDAKAAASHGHVLSDITDAGSAAAEDVGTSIGDVVQLEDVGGGTPGLPAVDGSQLTGLSAGSGDMLAATYDPQAVAGDAFDMDNMIEGTTTKILTDTERTKLSGIEAGATADQTAAEILTAIKTVDGAGSGLDADLLDGNSSAAFATAAQGALADSALQPADIASGTITPRADDVDLSGGSDGDVLTVQADGSLALEAPGVTGGSGAYDLDGEQLTLDADADTYVDTSADDIVDVFVGGVRVGRFRNDATIKGKFETRSTVAGAGQGPAIVANRDIAGADDNLIGEFRFDGNSDAGVGNVRNFGKLLGKINTAADGAEDGAISVQLIDAGAADTEVMLIEPGGVTFMVPIIGPGAALTSLSGASDDYLGLGSQTLGDALADLGGGILPWAQDVDAAGFGLTGLGRPRKEASGTTYTLLASDRGKAVFCSNVAGCTVTISDTLPPGDYVVLDETGGAGVTIDGSANVTVEAATSPSIPLADDSMGVVTVKRNAGSAPFCEIGGRLASAVTFAVDVTFSGDVDLPNGVVDNADLANMAQATFKMRAAGAGTGVPIDGTPAQAVTALALVEVFTGHIVTGSNKTYTLDEKAAFAYTINSLSIKTSSGTITAAVQINGTPVTGLSAVSVTSTQSETNGTAANSVSAGQRVTLALSSNSAALDIAFTLKITRA